jgi:hypothetical protein
MAVRLSALRSGRHLPPPGRFLVLVSVGGWVDPRAIVWLGWLGNLKKETNSSGLEPGIFLLCLNQLCYCVRHVSDTYVYTVSILHTMCRIVFFLQQLHRLNVSAIWEILGELIAAERVATALHVCWLRMCVSPFGIKWDGLTLLTVGYHPSLATPADSTSLSIYQDFACADINILWK